MLQFVFVSKAKSKHYAASRPIQQKSSKRRADALLVEAGYATSRERAQSLIDEGGVFADGLLVSKAAKLLSPDCVFDVRSTGIKWVSRAGLKLVGALDHFTAISLADKKALDIGASTGGFTEVMLAHGAAHVVALDVGSDQLHDTLANDPRVTVMDATNARHLKAADLPFAPDMITCDASFISLIKVLPAALALAAPDAVLIALIKPQFEVGKGLVGKGGIVRDGALHDKVVTAVKAWLCVDMGWRLIGVTHSPIDGPDGNKEFLIAAQKPT
ncbi:Predicted rRNA methylase [Candidatus Puniceispirillum marinum IMCC1322]|uniref:Predicted rRNA methylase n=1 Tax=Puniceispirillum marinum (strain IMCC1322) TaxID=488538 RepID=D5BSR0_PUNMI|nr:Predicted rRNA methylase [Candidatus Puniceispirillum marinum IMCC1322]